MLESTDTPQRWCAGKWLPLAVGKRHASRRACFPEFRSGSVLPDWMDIKFIPLCLPDCLWCCSNGRNKCVHSKSLPRREIIVWFPHTIPLGYLCPACTSGVPFSFPFLSFHRYTVCINAHTCSGHHSYHRSSSTPVSYLVSHQG